MILLGQSEKQLFLYIFVQDNVTLVRFVSNLTRKGLQEVQRDLRKVKVYKRYKEILERLKVYTHTHIHTRGTKRS